MPVKYTGRKHGTDSLRPGCTSDTSERRGGRKDDGVRAAPFSESFGQAGGEVLKPVSCERSPSSGRNGAALVPPPCSALAGNHLGEAWPQGPEG